MMRITATLVTGLCALAAEKSAAAEFVLQLPLGANATYSAIETTLAPLVPIGPFGAEGLPKERAAEHVRRTVWAFGGEQTLAEVQKNILEQLAGSGYDVLLFCQTDSCGGFDFRFEIDVVSEPAMRVDLRDYRFVSARQAVSEEPAYVTFLLSKSPTSVYVQMTEYAPLISASQPSQGFDQQPETREPDDLTETDGFKSYVLEGLEFETGSARLGADPDGSIAKLADILRQDRTLSVLLVGHSDMSGSLDGNIALSNKRAKSVMKSLISDHGIERFRLTANGVGFLSPRASNETELGTKRNRRVEAVFHRN